MLALIRVETNTTEVRHMTRTLWDSMRELQERMDSLFAEFFTRDPWGSAGMLEGPRALPVTNYRQAIADISETDKEVIATVELPGVDKRDIKVEATDDGIEIRVERKDEREEKKKGMYRLERSYAGFYRHIPLPDGVNVEKTKASYKNGVLELRVPKSEERRKTKLISVD